MNAKQSKRLRKEALKQAVEQGIPYVQYGFYKYKKFYTQLNGDIGTYFVYTVYLRDCQKKLYKGLKKSCGN